MKTQRIMAAALIAMGLGAIGGGWYTHQQVSAQLEAQRIVMPGDDSLETADQRDALEQWAGEMMSTGPQARAYADHYIADHVAAMTDGRTYQQVASELRAAKDDYGADSQQVKELSELKNTVFQGETLRSILLTAGAFWTMGTVALGAGILLLVLGAALLVVPALLASRRRNGTAEASGNTAG